MKVLVIFSLALATASAFDLRNAKIEQRNLVVPVVESEGRIINGQDAAAGEFPFQVGLSSKIDEFHKLWCSGSLIGPNWVLTAAHCTDGVKEEVIVYLGATILSEAEVICIVPKRNIIIHPGFIRKVLQNDISLIQIPEMTYSNNIRPVALPAISSSYSLYVGEKVIASGWGDTSDNGTSSNHLQWGEMEVIPNSECSKTYFVLFTTNICCDTLGRSSTCDGDSGGPMILESSRVQIGLTSFGSNDGCEKGKPVAFTRLTRYLEWIKNTTGISY